MSNPANATSLKSETPGMLLVVYLCLGLAVTSLSLLFSVIQMIAPDVYHSIEILVSIISLTELPMWGIAVILFLIWMYQVHKDLRVIFKTYSITPGGALAQLMIPFYNLWGIWNVFATFADKLKLQGGKLAEASSILRFLLPSLYAVSIAARIADRLLLVQERLNEQTDVSTLMTVTLGLEVLLWVIWLAMTKVIRQAVRYKFTEVQSDLAQKATGV